LFEEAKNSRWADIRYKSSMDNDGVHLVTFITGHTKDDYEDVRATI